MAPEQPDGGPVGYRTIFEPEVERQIAGWGLSDYLLLEIFVTLTDELSYLPGGVLIRDREYLDGMAHNLYRIDPASPAWFHVFSFHVLYGSDEHTLHVVRGSYWRCPLAR